LREEHQRVAGHFFPHAGRRGTLRHLRCNCFTMRRFPVAD
jgi:hypothetical protein